MKRIFLVLAILPRFASAQIDTAEDFALRCHGLVPVDECLNLIEPFIDPAHSRLCAQFNVETDRAVRVIYMFVVRNRHLSKWEIRDVARFALSDAFPCEKKQ